MAKKEPYIGFNDSGIVNLDSNNTGVQMLDKLARIKDDRRLQPIDQYDNIIYPHRYMYDGFNLLIGDTYFMIPPEFIMVSSESTSQSIVTLRQENTQKIKSGYHKRTILIDLVFNGLEQINGYKVEGPEGYYYVDGLRQLLAQFKCTPFLPITNELVNGMYGIFTVALQSITMSTMQGFPNVITAQITLQEVNMFPYIQMPDAYFKYMIDWDLFRFYYQRLLTEDHVYKKLQKLPANKEHNRFKLSILDESIFSSEEATQYNMIQIISDEKIVKTLDDNEPKTNYTEWVNSDTDNVFISSFQCGYSNILTNIQLSDSGSPTIQFMGGMDTIYNIVFETTDYSVVQSLEQCQMTNDILTRGNRKLASIGFVKLESELVEFTGSLFVMIESVVTNTVPGFPGLYNVQMNCVAYDIAQSKRENLHGFLPFDRNPDNDYTNQAIEQTMNGLYKKIKQDAYAEWKLRNNVEVYPDLQLPTYDEVDEVIAKIRDFRDKKSLTQLSYEKYPKAPTCMLHGLPLNNQVNFTYESSGVVDITSIDSSLNEYNVFVDPDFYVFYPVSYLSFLQDDEECYNAYSPKARNSRTKNKTTIATPYYVSADSNFVNKDNSGSILIEEFITEAKRYIGHKYVWGAAGEAEKFEDKVFDCSGFITYLFKAIGVIPIDGKRLTTSTIPTSDLFEEVPWDQMQRGDILWTKGHVVIYEGNNTIIHASTPEPPPKGGVKEDSLYFTGRCFRPKKFISTDIIGTSSYASIEQIRQQDLGKWPPITVDEMNNWIASKARSDSSFIGQGEVFIQAANESGLDPRYILAHAALESGWGTSRIARDKNNYFGIGAFDSSPYQSAHTFNAGLAAGIIGGAKWISEHYYNGKYNQKTLYSMRWNNNVHQYATDTEWDTKIASIMVGAPTSSENSSNFITNEYILTEAEFESICRIVMAETKGETSNAEKAMAQVIYDRLTHPDKKFGGLSNILNNNEQFKPPYQGELNSTIEKNVKDVFCSNEKYWPDCQAWYFLTPESNRATITDRDINFDRLEEVDKHIYWGEKSQGSNIRYTIEISHSTGNASYNPFIKIDSITHGTITIKEVKKFGQPTLVKTDAIMYDDTWLPWGDKEQKIAKENLNSTENTFTSSFCDEVQYSGRGKLVRAFPAYLFCILDDQAQWYDGRKLWTNYYVHRSVVDIAVHATNDMPTETATIVITNSYHNLDRTQGGLSSYSISEDSDYSHFVRKWYKLTGMLLGFGPKLTNRLIKLHQIIYDHAMLREGARVHLRMGYGSDPLSLAPVINGHISDVSLGDQISIIVTSDGHELIQHITSANEKDTNNGFLGLFGLGEHQESSNIIADVMCKRQSWVSHLMGTTFEGSKYSIEHFGLYYNKKVMSIIGNYALGGFKAIGTGIAEGIESGADIGSDVGEFIGADIPVLSSITEFVGLGVGGIIGTFGGLITGVVDGVITWANGVEDLISNFWDGWQEQYDLLKNVYKANYKRQHYIYTTVEIGKGDEQNVVFNKYNMTPWDVFQVCTQQVPEYIIKTTYHQFDSRLYFGLPSWMEKYRYDYLNGQVFEECKTASQVHFIESMDCIIDNQVKVTSRFSNTNIKVMYTKGSDPASTQTIHSDDTIDFSKQKTTILDSPICQDALGPDAIYEILTYNIGEESARRIGISNLLYGWQQQYQGQLLLIGHPGLKPHDFMMINDTFASLYGIAIVREVTHSFNTNTGFTSSVVPGMVGFSTDENSGMIETTQNYLMLLNCFSSYTQLRKNLRNNYEKNISAVADMEAMREKLIVAVHKQVIRNRHKVVAQLAAYPGVIFIGYRIFKFGKGLYNIKIAETFLMGYNVLDDAGNVIKTIKGFKTVATAGKGIKNTLSAIKAGTVATGTAAGGFPGIILATVWIAVDILLQELFEWFSNKNVCALLPLWWEGYPFVAGVKDGEKILLMQNNSTATDDNTRKDRTIVEDN